MRKRKTNAAPGLLAWGDAVFDWLRFLRVRGVPYVTRGPNVGPGQVAVKCPWCGPSDPSQHLSISLRDRGYRCWRNPRAHVGRSRSKLIAALLNCSPEEAHRLAGEELPATPADESLLAELKRMTGGASQAPSKVVAPLALPSEARPLRYGGLGSMFCEYLAQRGLDPEWCQRRYNLHYALTGPYRYRIVIPVYDSAGRLMTWTARSIKPAVTTRYKTLLAQAPAEDYTGPVALKPPGELLLDAHKLLATANPVCLLVVEGPFDAIKITALGERLGIYGTCLFGLGVSESQALLIEQLSGRFERVVGLLDPDAATLNLRLREMLTCPLEFGRLPPGVEDPGALTATTFTVFVEGLNRNSRGLSHG